MKLRISIQGMMSTHCAMGIKDALSTIEGVEFVEVDLEKGTAIVDSATAIPEETLAAAITETGHTMTAVTTA